MTSRSLGVFCNPVKGAPEGDPVAYCGSTLLFSDGVARRRSSRRRRIFLRFPFRDMRRKSAPFREGISSCGRSVRGKSRQTTRRVVGT